MDKYYRLEINPDIGHIYTLGDGCSYEAWDDEVYNFDYEYGPCYSIVLPGICDWFRRYEGATDFSVTTTEPSFDWRAWHIEGLQLAKELRRHLPASVRLYYRPPYEDTSGLLPNILEDDEVDTFIQELCAGAYSYLYEVPVQPRFRIEVLVEEEGLRFVFLQGAGRYDFLCPWGRLKALRQWLEHILQYPRERRTLRLGARELKYFPKLMGAHQYMARVWLYNAEQRDCIHSLYSDYQDFVRALYVSAMTALTSGSSGCDVDVELEHRRLARTLGYNQLRSAPIETMLSALSVDEPSCRYNACRP